MHGLCTWCQALCGLVELLRSRVWGVIDQLRHECSKIIIESALTSFVQAEVGHQLDGTRLVEERQQSGNAYEAFNENPHLQQQHELQQQSKHPDALHCNVPSQLLSIPVTESGKSCEQQRDQLPLKQQEGKEEQLQHGDDYDVYLVTILSAEASIALAPVGLRQMQPQLDNPTGHPPVCESQARIPAATHQDTFKEKTQSPECMGAHEQRSPPVCMVRPNEEETPVSLLAGQAATTGLPAATAQLQWIREALIMLRRIDDPQYVQLQRRKKTAATAGASAASPSPTQHGGSTLLPEDTADASTVAPLCPGSYKCVLPPPPRSSRLLYVMWVGVGGGPWGGRSNTWFNHRRCVSTDRNDESAAVNRVIAAETGKTGN